MIGDKDKASRVAGKIERQIPINYLEEITFRLGLGYADRKGICYDCITKKREIKRGWTRCEPVLWGWGRTRRVLEIVALHYASRGVKVRIRDMDRESEAITRSLNSPTTSY